MDCIHSHVKQVDRWYGHGQFVTWLCNDCGEYLRPIWLLARPKLSAATQGEAPVNTPPPDSL